MNAAAQTPGLPNPPTGAVCLLAVARWLVALFILHWLVIRGRTLAAALYKSWGPDDAFLAAHFGTTDRARILTHVTRVLHRAGALETELLARRPTEQEYPLDAH